MRILVATPADSNPFVHELHAALAVQDRIEGVEASVEALWSGPADRDVLHIHWPESLTTDWSEPTGEELERLERVLGAWRKEAVVVATVHNRHPHYRDTERFRALYDLVYRASHGIVHLGEVSRREIPERHPHLADRSQAVIPLGLFPSIPNRVDRAEALRALGLEREHFVAGFLGTIRHREELSLLLRGFGGVGAPNKRLVLAGAIRWPGRRHERWWMRLQLSANRRLVWRRGYVPDAEVQRYVQPLDVMVVPRKEVLNSAIVLLGFTFGKVVVGPACGNVGEILRETGNPTYAPGDARSLADAIERGRELALQNHGVENLRYGRERWSWNEIARRHVEFYRELRRRMPR